LQVSFGRNSQVSVPPVVSSANDVAFIAEAAPLPVRQLGVGGPALTPHKAGGIFVFTRELLEHSIPNTYQAARWREAWAWRCALDAAAGIVGSRGKATMAN
jgi:hypothetical protein